MECALPPFFYPKTKESDISMKILKRSFVLLVALIIFLASFQCCIIPARATGTEYTIFYQVLQSILEATAGSMGYSYSSQADLTMSVNGLEQDIKNKWNEFLAYSDYKSQIESLESSGDWEGLSTFINEHLDSNVNQIYKSKNSIKYYSELMYLYAYYTQNSDATVPSEYTVNYIETINFLENFVRSQASQSSSTKYGENSAAHFVAADGSDCAVYYKTITEPLVHAYSYQKDIKSADGATDLTISPSFYNRKSFATRKITTDIGWDSYYIVPASSGNFVYVVEDGVLYIYSRTGDQSWFIFNILHFDESKGYCYPQYTPNYIGYNADPSVDPLAASSTFLASTHAYFGMNYNRMNSINLTEYKVMLSPDCTVYNSFAEFETLTNIMNNHSLSGTLRGSNSAGKAISIDTPITITSVTTAKKVEDAISNAKAENPDITDDEIDTLVDTIISGNEKVEDAVQDSTQATIDSGNKIFAAVKAFQNAWTDGSSAIKQKVDDIADQFSVVQGGGSDPDEDPDDDPHIWQPNLIFTVKFLQPLFDYFGDPLSQVTKFLDRIMNSMEALPLLFDDSSDLYLGNVFVDIAGAVNILGGMARTLGNLPAAIASELADILQIPVLSPAEIVEAFNNGLIWPEYSPDVSVNVPDVQVTFPEFPNYFGILQQILEAIQAFLILDMDAVGQSVDDLQDEWQSHFKLFYDLVDIYKSIKVSNEYDYPVIKMQTPEILSPYYVQDYIVLIDFADYASYLVWIRGIIRAILWVSFGYYIIRHFDVSFHVG